MPKVKGLPIIFHLIFNLIFLVILQVSKDWTQHQDFKKISKDVELMKIYSEVDLEPGMSDFSKKRMIVESIDSFERSMVRLCLAWKKITFGMDRIPACKNSNPCELALHLIKLNEIISSNSANDFWQNINKVASIIIPGPLIEVSKIMFNKKNLTITNVTSIENQLKRIPTFNDENLRLLKIISIQYLDFAKYHGQCFNQFYYDDKLAEMYCPLFADIFEEPFIEVKPTNLGKGTILASYCNIGKKLTKKIKFSIIKFSLAMSSLPFGNDFWSKCVLSSYPVLSVCLPFQMILITAFIIFPKTFYTLRTLFEIFIPVNCVFGCGCIWMKVSSAFTKSNQSSQIEGQGNKRKSKNRMNNKRG